MPETPLRDCRQARDRARAATTDDTYFERGSNLRHGYLTEYYVDDPKSIVKAPGGLRHVGVLLEPLTIDEKGIAQAYEIPRRLKVWRPATDRSPEDRPRRDQGVLRRGAGRLTNPINVVWR
jgi:hypothetical protein